MGNESPERQNPSLDSYLVGLVTVAIRRELERILPVLLQNASPASAGPTAEPVYLTAAEAADIARVSKRTIAAWARRGDLFAVRAGRGLRIRRSDLDAHLARDEAAREPVDCDDRVAEILDEVS